MPPDDVNDALSRATGTCLGERISSELTKEHRLDLALRRHTATPYDACAPGCAAAAVAHSARGLAERKGSPAERRPEKLNESGV